MVIYVSILRRSAGSTATGPRPPARRGARHPAAPGQARPAAMSYCASRFSTVRRATVESEWWRASASRAPSRARAVVTTSDTQDIAPREAVHRVGQGRLRDRPASRPNRRRGEVPQASARITGAGFGHVPLVADIHFLPQRAMEPSACREVRINPGQLRRQEEVRRPDTPTPITIPSCSG